jgi:hypothetical protein
VVSAFPAEVFGASRRLLGQGQAARIFAIQEAQGIFRQAAPAIGTKPFFVLAIVSFQGIKVMGPTAIAADAVKAECEPFQSQLYIKLPSNLNDLGIEGRVGISYGFNAELVMLTVSARLGTLISEDCSHIVEPYWLGQVIHPVLHISTAHRGSSLGAQGELVSALILKGVHLLLNDVGILADTAYKKSGVLKCGSIDSLIAI